MSGLGTENRWTLQAMEPLCACYAQWHDELQSLLSDLEAEVQALKRVRMKSIKAAMKKVAGAHSQLKDAGRSGGSGRGGGVNTI